MPAPAGRRRGDKEKNGDGYRALLTIVVAVVAALGQVEGARTIHFVHMIQTPGVANIFNSGWSLHPIDFTPWLAAAVFDLTVAALLFGGRKVYRKYGLTPWLFWSAAWGIAGLSVYVNAKHVGGEITASASAVVFLTWFLELLAEYLAWRRNAGHRANAVPNLLVSKLLVINARLAYRAWVIASFDTLTRGVAYRKEKGEDLTARALAILAARLYLDIYDDQLAHQLDTASKPASGSDQPVRLTRSVRKAARSRAVMTADDAVNHFLGQPVIDRTGIKVGGISYAQTVDDTVARTPARPAPAAVPAPRIPRSAATPVSAPTAVAPVSAPPAPTAVPDVPAEWFERHRVRIDNVIGLVGDAWWNQATPMTVDDVQGSGARGTGNRGNASQVAACLKVRRAQKLQGANTTPEGGSA